MKYDLGFLGGGQLARMSIQAAQRMGLKCVSLDADQQTPASKIAHFLVGSLKDPSKVREVFDCAERVTLENEFIPAHVINEAVRSSEDLKRLIPNLDALATIQDKLLQRQALVAEKVPSPRAVILEDTGESAVMSLGFPMVLKARFGGYDGKGTRYAKNFQELESLKSEWGSGGWLAEQFVPFKRELAVMVVIGSTGTYCFPTVHTIQTNSVCDIVSPCTTDASLIAIAAVEAVGGTGLFGVELFELADGEILVNELAPRPHNSGHYTLDWGGPSQFEYHVRAVMGLPVSKPVSNEFAVMANLLGQSKGTDYAAALQAALTHQDAFVHWYEKDEVKIGRKMGHINVVGRDMAEIETVIETARKSRQDFYRAWGGE